MEKLLQDLEDLGVYIPAGMNDEQLLRYAKQLNPWTVTSGHNPDSSPEYWATTSKPLAPQPYTLEQLHEHQQKHPNSWVWAQSETQAALGLLHMQLQAGQYDIHAVGYKLHAQQRNH